MSFTSYHSQKLPGNASKFSFKRIFAWSSVKMVDPDSASSKTLEKPPSVVALLENDTAASSLPAVRTVAKMVPKAESMQVDVLLDGLETAAKVLEVVSGNIPFIPAKDLIGVGIKIITLFKNARHARIEALELCNRIASYVLLTVEAIKGKDMEQAPELAADLALFNNTLVTLHRKLNASVPSDQHAIVAAMKSRGSRAVNP
ncbi:hypothetical protein CVT24_000601 [Panaeolus cyanescens]|uniref:Uncharacterized protein n=1 Tax=Panaeolus cyanescens TaxID=181874 RepID=A0A409YDI0_9AGAR|nr:hypothetical protein CVT24_000601 [Panaeolus cyanescens]